MAKDDRDNNIIQALTLLLLWLTSWEEKVGSDIAVHRSWKGYNFEVINKLLQQGLIQGSYKAKSAYLTEAGIVEAKRLEKKYLKHK